MEVDALYQTVSRWYATGLLLETDKPDLKAAYEELVGDSGDRCRTCPNYWSDVLRDLRYHLIKVLGYPAMKDNREYMIREDAGFLQVHGLPYVYINEGHESDSAKLLTDAIAIALLEENPGRSEVIVKNPNYEGSAKPAASTTKPVAPKAPAAKAAAPKAAKGKKAPAEPVTPPVTDETNSAPVPAVDPTITTPVVAAVEGDNVNA